MRTSTHGPSTPAKGAPIRNRHRLVRMSAGTVRVPRCCPLGPTCPEAGQTVTPPVRESGHRMLLRLPRRPCAISNPGPHTPMPQTSEQDLDQARTNSAQPQSIPTIVAGQRLRRACTTRRRKTSSCPIHRRSWASSRNRQEQTRQTGQAGTEKRAARRVTGLRERQREAYGGQTHPRGRTKPGRKLQLASFTAYFMS